MQRQTAIQKGKEIEDMSERIMLQYGQEKGKEIKDSIGHQSSPRRTGHVVCLTHYDIVFKAMIRE